VLRTYVNGTALTATTVTTAFYLTPQTCTIGNRLDIGASNFPGYLDEVRISNVARYGGSFTPPAVPFLSLNTDTSLLVHADGANGSTAFIDSSIYAHTLTASGSAQVTTSSPKFGTGSVTFSSGVGSVSAGASVDLEFASLPFTVEAWAYFTAAPDSSYRAIISKYSDVGTSHLESWWFGIDNSSKLAFLWSLDGTYNVSLNLLGAISPTLNTWYHLAADRDAAGTLRIYLNGAVLNSASVTESFFPSSAACLIGDDGTPTSVSFPGNLDEIRVTKGLARYGGAFTPPAQAFLPEYTVGLTQAAQTLSATGNVSTGTAITGTLNVTQTGQTLAATGTVTVGGTLSVTQAAQTLAATGGITVGGTLGVTQAAQTLAATGWSAAFGPIAATQAPHTLVALGVDVLGGTLVVTQAPQTLAAAGSPRVGGTLGITQAPQTLAALGGPVVGGTLGVTQATQTLAAAGWRAATGTLAVTQAPQTLAGLGSVVTGTSGSLLLTQAPQTLSASATLGGVTGALGITQAPQILAGIGVVTPTISGTLNLTQEEQILVATAVVFTPSAVTTQARVLVMA
jgi:hypothetical protein